MEHYENYVGQFVKRFAAPFEEEYIYKIKAHRISSTKYIDDEDYHDYPEFLYSQEGKKDWWADCEDSCIITNEMPIKKIDWVANVYDEKYTGFNPFTKTEIKKIETEETIKESNAFKKYFEDVIYLCKDVKVKILNIRNLLFVFRKRKYPQKQGIGIWWKKSIGVGIIGKPYKVLKYLMIGFNFINLTGWITFTWIGKSDEEKQPIQLREGSHKIEI